MALALEAAGGVDAVGAGLERLEQVDDLELAGAGQLDHADVRRVLQAHAARQVGGRVGAVVTGEDDDLGLEALVCRQRGRGGLCRGRACAPAAAAAAAAGSSAIVSSPPS